ncbi:ABC transporter substrate-binding protein [Paenibacillus prosopidis]|uniref:Raffinose/stachyose/melibiose transport system substrate-binding protein n=1 Tax=Paenibacillus prosopidis TaxID=630520 RepID=A0A368W3J6_9BACL|nr:ABC transporter substrate-binding protein [Paenibacillus prosopidis]RCW48536.1 raffinose/stachyose/melibiose transport system substrate-binding protein [Paenibacillus prosopidis]
MKKGSKALFLLCLSILLTITACSGQNGNSTVDNTSNGTEDAASPKKEVVLNIPHYKSGQNVGAKFFLPQVERFNNKYAGQYKIVIEEIPQDDYAAKIKLLAQQNELPALIEGGDKDFLRDVIVKGEKFYDLKQWIDSKPEMKKLMVEESLVYNTTQSGKIVSLPIISFSPIGLYYNKEMFEKAGITKPISQMNFAEFDEALESLKKAGFTPLSLMSGENAWTSMLLASSFLANEPGGAELLKSTEFSYDYTDPMWINTFAEIKKWFEKYTTDNAIGAGYADAANNFLNERTAIIANGPWMVPDFSDTTKAAEGLDKKVGASIYPGGVALATVNEYTWWIPKGLKEEETQAALAFLEFMSMPEEKEAEMVLLGGTSPKLETSAEFDSKLDPILLELNNTIKSDLKQTVQSLGIIWPEQIAGTEFGKFLPLLAKGTLTPEQFAEEMTKKAQQFKK